MTFPDVPEAITQGDTMEEALEMASEALEVALTFYTEQGKDLPAASAPKRGMRQVRVSALRLDRSKPPSLRSAKS